MFDSENRREVFDGFSFATPKFIQGGGSLLEPLLTGYPKFVPTLHDISQHRSSQKYHVLPSRRVFDPDLKFLRRYPLPSITLKIRRALWGVHTFKRVGSPLSTRVRYSCFISFSKREGSPGYILEPPERTTCLYSSVRMSTAAVWMVEKSISVWEVLGVVLKWGKKLLTGNARLFDVYEMWLEHAFRCLEPLLADLNDTAIR